MVRKKIVWDEREPGRLSKIHTITFVKIHCFRLSELRAKLYWLPNDWLNLQKFTRLISLEKIKTNDFVHLKC